MPNPGDQAESTPETQQSPDQMLWTGVAVEAGLGVVAIVLGWLFGPDPRALIPDLQWDQWWPIASGILYGLLAAIPVLLVTETIERLPLKSVAELEKLSDMQMFQALWSLRPGELLLISVCAGIGEELLFRGWLFCWISGLPLEEAATPQLVAAFVISSFCFGLFHPFNKLYIAIVSLVGLYFAWLMIWSGNLLVPITAHAAYDAIQLLYGRHQNKKRKAAAK